MSEHRIQGASFPVALLMLAIAIYLTVGIVTMDVPDTAGTPGPKFFPTIITIGCFIVSGVMFLQSFRQLQRERHNSSLSDPATDDEVGAIERSNWKTVGIVILSFVLFIALLQPLGWLISAGLLFFGVAYGLGSKDLFNNAVAGFIISAVIQLTFSGLLGINLPAGILGGF